MTRISQTSCEMLLAAITLRIDIQHTNVSEPFDVLHASAREVTERAEEWDMFAKACRAAEELEAYMKGSVRTAREAIERKANA